MNLRIAVAPEIATAIQGVVETAFFLVAADVTRLKSLGEVTIYSSATAHPIPRFVPGSRREVG